MRDLEAIGAYIARDDPAAAARWIDKLVSTVARAASAPGSGRRVPELARDDVRELLLRSYRIVYRVTPARSEILTVSEGRRLDQVAPGTSGR